MDRRAFVGALALLTSAHDRVHAQPRNRIPRVGFLTYTTPEQSTLLLREFTDGLRALGHVEGSTIVIEPLYGDGTQDRLDALAAEIVRSRVDIIVTGTNPIALAARRATSTIPIVTVAALDPVGAGLVNSLARPGGNVTGLSVDASAETSGKELGLLKEIVPGLTRLGWLRQVGYHDPRLEEAARKLDVQLVVVDVRSHDELDAAFAMLRQQRAGAMKLRGSLFYVQRHRVAELAIKHRLPTVHALRDYAEAGLLLAYGPNLGDLFRRAATYVDRIVKGARAGDLPVEQPTKFDLVINLKTAKALGLEIPMSLLLRADEVIR